MTNTTLIFQRIDMTEKENHMSNFIGEYLSERYNFSQGENIEFSDIQLRKIWDDIFGNLGNEWEEGYDVYEETFSILANSGTPKLALRSGGWTIKLSEGLLQTGVIVSFLSGVFYMAGIHAVPVFLLSSILQILLQIEKVRLTKSEENILLELTLQDEVVDRLHKKDDLYRFLPAEIKERLSRNDFEDFFDKLLKAGTVKEHREGIEVYPLGNAKITISII